MTSRNQQFQPTQFNIGCSYTEHQVRELANGCDYDFDRIGVERTGGSLVTLSRAGKVCMSFLFMGEYLKRVF